METANLKEKAEDITTHVGDYLDTWVKLASLNIAQKAANTGSHAISTLITAVLGFFVLIFVGIGAAWWVGDLISSRAGGFFIMGGFFLVVLLCIVLLRKKVITPYLRNNIIRKIYE